MIKICQMNLNVFSNKTLLEFIDCFFLVFLNRDNDSKRFKIRRYYLPKSIIKNCNVIINGKNVYGQLIDSDIKRYEEYRKLTRA